MPKLDTPDIRLGFYVGIGLFLAMLVMSFALMLLQRARGRQG